MQLTTIDEQKKRQEYLSRRQWLRSKVLKNRGLSQRNRVAAASKILSIAVAIACSCQSLKSQAQNRLWTNTSNSSSWFDVGSNWSPAGAPGSSSFAGFQQAATYQVWWDGTTVTLTPSVGLLGVTNGNVTFQNQNASPQHQLIINGSGGAGSVGDFEIGGSTTSLTIRGLHIRSLGGARVYDGGTLTLDGSHTAGTRMSVEGSSGFLLRESNLNILAGAVLSTTNSELRGGIGQVTGTGSKWINAGSLTLGSPFVAATLNIGGGGEVSSGTGSISVFGGNTCAVNVSGAGSKWTNTGLLTVGLAGTGTLDVQGGGQVSSGTGSIGSSLGSNGTVTVSGTGSKWTNSGGLDVGSNGMGKLDVLMGGEVSNGVGYIGRNAGSNGTVTVSGAGSKWINSSSWLDVGSSGTGTLNVLGGGQVSSISGYVGIASGSNGTVTVSGTGSKWTNSGALEVGSSGFGKLDVLGGGEVSNGVGYIGRNAGSNGTVTVSGAGSKWTNSISLSVGYGQLNINNAGLVTVGGTTTIDSNGQVTLNGGRFEFGITSLASYARIGGTSGSLVGQIPHSAFTNVSTMTALQNSNLDATDVILSNSGTLVGTGILGTAFTNTSTGRIDVSGSSIMRFEGDSNTNQGIINSTGGMLSMAGNLTNSASGQISNFGGQIVTQGQINNAGFITGRGEFTANGGFANTGSMAFSGTADINGNVTNNNLIVTSANATTTFYDSVTNLGEIRTSGNGNSVFFETVSGNGSYTGTGNVFFEGNVNPGNSPSVVNFGGNLTLGTASHTVFELGGLALGDYDRFNIAGNLNLLGSMSVEMWNGFQLSPGMSFLIADIGGTRTGTFAGLGEGAVVGNFNGQDLFISYSLGNGNDIGLFTAIPEPSTAVLLTLFSTLIVSRRRRVA